MRIKSESDNQSVGVLLFKFLNDNLFLLLIAATLFFVFNSNDKPEEKFYHECSTLTKQERLVMDTTITARLALVKDSINDGIKNGNHFKRDDMTDLIKQITDGVKDEFCQRVYK